MVSVVEIVHAEFEGASEWPTANKSQTKDFVHTFGFGSTISRTEIKEGKAAAVAYSVYRQQQLLGKCEFLNSENTTNTHTNETGTL